MFWLFYTFYTKLNTPSKNFLINLWLFQNSRIFQFKTLKFITYYVHLGNKFMTKSLYYSPYNLSFWGIYIKSFIGCIIIILYIIL